MRWLWLVFTLQGVLMWGKSWESNPLYRPCALCYGLALPAQELKPYNPMILQPCNRIPFLYAPINLSEVSRLSPHPHEVENLILTPKGRDTLFADLRQERWINRMGDKMIPDLIVQGFQGILIDALDDVLDPEKKEKEKFAGIKKSAIQLMQLIHVFSPSLLIMMNRSVALLPPIGNLIKALLAKGVLGRFAEGNNAGIGRFDKEHSLKK